MKLKLSSLRFRMLLPVIAMTLFVVVLLTVLFSRAYTSMILQQEQDENAAGFELISRSVTPLIESSIARVQSVLSDSRVASYARHQYATDAQMVHERISCRDYLRGELSRQEGIFGLLFMRQNGSLFGVLPEFNFFLDDPQQNPLSEDMISQILNVPLGQTIWVGPTSGATLYGFENEKTPQSIMIAAWKSVDVRYGGALRSDADGRFHLCAAVQYAAGRGKHLASLHRGPGGGLPFRGGCLHGFRAADQ